MTHAHTHTQTQAQTHKHKQTHRHIDTKRHTSPRHTKTHRCTETQKTHRRHTETHRDTQRHKRTYTSPHTQISHHDPHVSGSTSSSEKLLCQMCTVVCIPRKRALQLRGEAQPDHVCPGSVDVERPDKDCEALTVCLGVSYILSCISCQICLTTLSTGAFDESNLQ